MILVLPRRCAIVLLVAFNMKIADTIGAKEIRRIFITRQRHNLELFRSPLVEVDGAHESQVDAHSAVRSGAVEADQYAIRC